MRPSRPFREVPRWAPGPKPPDPSAHSGSFRASRLCDLISDRNFGVHPVVVRRSDTIFELFEHDFRGERFSTAAIVGPAHENIVDAARALVRVAGVRIALR